MRQCFKMSSAACASDTLQEKTQVPYFPCIKNRADTIWIWFGKGRWQEPDRFLSCNHRVSFTEIKCCWNITCTHNWHQDSLCDHVGASEAGLSIVLKMTTPVPTAVPFTPHLHQKSPSLNTSCVNGRVLVHEHQPRVGAVVVVGQSHALTEAASLLLGAGSLQLIPLCADTQPYQSVHCYEENVEWNTVSNALCPYFQYLAMFILLYYFWTGDRLQYLWYASVSYGGIIYVTLCKTTKYVFGFTLSCRHVGMNKGRACAELFPRRLFFKM